MYTSGSVLNQDSAQSGAEGLLWPSMASAIPKPRPKSFFHPPLRSARRPPHSRLCAAAGPLRLRAPGSPFPSSTSPSPRPSPPPRPPAAVASSTWSTTTGPSASPRSTPRWRSPPCAPSTSSPPPSAPRHARRGLLLLQRRPVSGPRRELARHHPDSVRAREARPGAHPGRLPRRGPRVGRARHRRGARPAGAPLRGAWARAHEAGGGFVPREGKVRDCHYYPVCPEPERTMGLVSHTDPGVLTVLAQDCAGGLQVKQSSKPMTTRRATGWM